MKASAKTAPSSTALPRLERPETGVARILRTLLLAAGAAMVIHVSGMGVKYASHLFFARWMGPAEYGTYAYALGWALLLSVFAGLGLKNAVVRFLPIYQHDEQWDRLRGLLRFSHAISVASGLVLALIGMAVTLGFMGFTAAAAPLLIGLALVPLLAMQNLCRELIRATRHVALALLPPQLLTPTLVLGTACVAWYGFGTLTAGWLLTITAAVVATLLLMQHLSLRRVLADPVHHAAPHYVGRQWLAVSLPMLLTSGCMMVQNQSGILIVGTMLTPVETGLFAAAAKTAILTESVLMAIKQLLAPMIARAHHQGDRAAVQRMCRIATSLMLLPSALIAGGLIVFGEALLGLFGEAFVAAYPALVLLAAGQLINAAAGPVGLILNMTGHERIAAKTLVVAVTVNVVLTVALIPAFGILGAAMAFLVSMAIWNGALYLFVRQRLGIRPLI